MQCHEFETANEMYAKMIPLIVEGKDIQSADDKIAKGEAYKSDIHELTQVLIQLNTQQLLTSIPSMAQTPFWAISEIVSEMINANPPLMDKYAPNIMESSYKLGPNRMPIYTYGSRWYEHDALYRIYLKLKDNPTSKRCFMPIFAGYDLEPTRPDIPCTLGHMFQIRDNKLSVNAIYRSKDCFAGFKYDPLLSQFLQWTMVAWLNASGHKIELGKLTFFDESLHYYPEKDSAKYHKFKDEIKHIDEKIYKNSCDGVELCWKPSDYYSDLHHLVNIERLCYQMRRRNVAVSVLHKFKIPLLRDFAIVYMLKNENAKFDVVRENITYDFIENWYAIYYGAKC